MSDEIDLFEGNEDGPDLGPFNDAPEAAEKQERGRGGRPRGVPNKHTQDFEKYYYAQGFTDPLIGMARFLTADPVQLQAWFEKHERTGEAIGKMTGLAVPSLEDIIKQQHWCAKELAPYLHGKKPIQLQLIDERLPTLVINLGTNQADQARRVQDGRLSAGSPLIEQEAENEQAE